MPSAKLPHDHHSAIEQSFDHMPDEEAFAAAAGLFKLLSDQTRLKTMLQTMESRREEIQETCRAMAEEASGLEAAFGEAGSRLKREEEEQNRLETELRKLRKGAEKKA